MIIAVIIVLAVIGIIDSLYLLWHYYKKKPLVCTINHDCNKVSQSKWASLFGLRNEFYGLLFYIAVIAGLILALILAYTAPLIYLLLFVASSLALAYSIILIFIQIFAIKEFCLYCLISSGVNVLIFIGCYILFTRMI